MKEIVKAEIVIAGGGLAGVCAAVSAARELRRKGLEACNVVLVHDRPVLGGCSSSEVRVPPIGAGRHAWGYETGIINEILNEERKRNHTCWDNGTANSIWDLILWETIKKENNIMLYLNAYVRDIRMHGEDKSTIAAVLASQSGNEKELEIHGKLFVDATGDGTVGAKAGAEFRIGREASGEFDELFAPEMADNACMGSSLLFQARDIGKPTPFIPPPYSASYPTEESLCCRPHADFRNGYWWIEVGVPYHTIEQNNEIKEELIRHVLGVWDHVKNHCPQWKEKAQNWVLDWFGWVPGKRESRRLLGDYILNEKDIRSARLFDDRVAYGGHFLDLHTMGGILAKDRPGNPVDVNPELYDKMRVIPYSIPLRSLYSRNIHNLMMAGRNLSASHVAMGSTRVMLTNAVMGQGVGTAAAVCIEKNITPRECAGTYIWDIQQSLLRQDCYIPLMPNADPGDLAGKAGVLSSSDAVLHMEPETDPDGNILFPDQRQRMDVPLGVLFPVSGDTIQKVELWLESDEDTPVQITLGLRKAGHVWDYSESARISSASATVKPCSSGWVSFEFNAAAEPGSLYWVYSDTIGNTAGSRLFWRYRLDIPTGGVSVWKRLTSNYWYYLNEGYRKGFRMLCMRLEPASYPYKASNIINGVTRPEKWTNLWISDPDRLLPQYVELDWEEAVCFDCVEITFDTDLSLTNESTQPFTCQPKCVRDYAVAVKTNENWRTVLEVRDNYQRKRIHTFDAVTTDKMRIMIQATNGDPSARIYEVRVYRREGKPEKGAAC